jgi:hypothetical protein
MDCNHPDTGRGTEPVYRKAKAVLDFATPIITTLN